MRYEIARSLVLPSNQRSLEIRTVDCEENGEIKEGALVEPSTQKIICIRNFIPRFVENEAYTTSFGLEWNLFRRTQIDRFNGTTISAKRFYAGTGWLPEELQRQRILEVGCGAGRFTQIMLDAGAEVWALDYSTAVDACWTNNGPHRQLCIVQGDMYSMPFPKSYFDKVFCFGVLQYVPDPKKAFLSLVPFLRPGGKLAVDAYGKEKWPTRWTSRHLWRPITKRIPPKWLFRIVNWYVPRWLPYDNSLDELRLVWRFAKYVRGTVPCFNYTGILPLTKEQIREWAILDTFNVLAPLYEHTQTVTTLRSWFEEAGLDDIDVRYGSNGIVGTAHT